MKYKCIIFDCDGVLVDSELISFGVLIEMAEKLGVKIDLNFALKNFQGKSLECVIEYMEDILGHRIPSDFEKLYREKSFEAFKNNVKPIDGVPELLERIKIPYCVASGGPIEKIRLNLSTAKLLDKFENKIFSSYEINSWKPDPGIFLFAAEKMGFTPTECVVIEDSLSGVIAAQNGGFDVLVYVQGKNLFDNPDLKYFYNMEDLDLLLS